MIITLPQAVGEWTHARITDIANRDGNRIRLIGEYGKDLPGGFQPGLKMEPYTQTIIDDFLEDLITESEKRGRPVTKSRMSMDLEDVRDWIEENGAAARVQAVVDAREAARIAAELEAESEGE